MSSTTIFLRFERTLQFAQDVDSLSNFKEMKESSEIEIDDQEIVTWKISTNPGTLERIKIKKVNKKDNVSLPRGSWKDQWLQAPKRVNDSEYTGQPDGSGATDANPYFFAYDVEYKISTSNGWKCLDPDIRIPRSM